MILWGDCPATILQNEPVGRRTTWRIGGLAQFYAEPADEIELKALLWEAQRRGVRPYILGGGSNLLIGDHLLEGIVISLRSHGPLTAVRIEPNTTTLIAGGGAHLTNVLHWAANSGLSGLEAFAGIPGTIGGAVRVNAGTAQEGIGAYVTHVRGIDYSGHLVERDRSEIDFHYRGSNLADLVITEVTLALRQGYEDAIKDQMSAFIERKHETQPLGQRTAGCVFRNPSGASAGALIDQAGLKGMSIGEASISMQHANFFLNRDRCSFLDMLRLMEYAREMVLRQHGVELTREVCLWV